MQTLLLQLPTEAPSAHAVYGLARLDPLAVDSRLTEQATPLSLLPRPERHEEVVLMVPAAALSWHQVSLPEGLGRAGGKSSARLQAALAGLLEERLLQEPAQLHFALAPAWRAGEPTWVAVCERAWLRAHRQALEEAGLQAQRIVPELFPPPKGQVWHAIGDMVQGGLWCCSAESGVAGWPLAAATQLPAAWLEGMAVQTEPALAQWVQTRLKADVQLVDTARHWRQALTSPWDLAQFELQSKRGGRGMQRMHKAALQWLTQPLWRPTRWGLSALLAAQLVGLNAWAWMTQSQWDTQQQRWTDILQQSFPKVTVVIDAPLQMAREVSRLRQGSGQLSPQDFEAMLHALGTALPAGVPGPKELNYQDGRLQWPAMALSEPQKSVLMQALAGQGYRLETADSTWQLQTQEVRP